MKPFSFRSLFILAASTGALALSAGLVHAGEQVNVYTYRQTQLIKPLFAAFTKKTGIKVNFIFAKKGLIERIAAEGENSPADVLLTTDIGRLTAAVQKGIAQPVNDPVLTANIPATYRDPQNLWFGLTRRARVVFASRDRVKQKAITYEELADPKWKGRICIRSGHHVYNIALFAAMVAHYGEQRAEQWLKGLKANLARRPSGNDRGQVKAVYSGQCDLAIGNTYYMAKMQLNRKHPEQQAWAKSVRILFPTFAGGKQGSKGTHINISGMVLAKYAPHKASAIKLMEFLTSDEAQRIYASVNHEYPVKQGVAWSDLVKSWGTFTPDSLPLAEIAQKRDVASRLVDSTGFNQGPSS